MNDTSTTSYFLSSQLGIYWENIACAPASQDQRMSKGLPFDLLENFLCRFAGRSRIIQDDGG
jgi:hypothetical protein